MFKNIKTAEDLANEEILQKNIQKIVEAKTYLADTDFYMTIDKYATLTEERKLELTQLRAEAREFIRANEVIDVK